VVEGAVGPGAGVSIENAFGLDGSTCTKVPKAQCWRQRHVNFAEAAELMDVVSLGVGFHDYGDELEFRRTKACLMSGK